MPRTTFATQFSESQRAVIDKARDILGKQGKKPSRYAFMQSAVVEVAEAIVKESKKNVGKPNGRTKKRGQRPITLNY